MAQETVLEGAGCALHPRPRSGDPPGGFHRDHPPGRGCPGYPRGAPPGEISILSRVGKPTACVVTGVEEAPFRLTLSRRRAQEQALETLLACPAGNGPSRHRHPSGPFWRLCGCGMRVVSMIGIENCSVARISHPARQFRLGQEIYGVLTGGDRALGRVYLSHKELLGTWMENAARFSPGMTVLAGSVG